VWRFTGTVHEVYVNGILHISFSSAAQTNVNSTVAHVIGRQSNTASEYLDGYLSEINFIDGQALTPSAFGETNTDGVWVPKKYSGTYGTNGFHLDFKNGTSITTLGYDAAGSNSWTPTGFSLTVGATYDWMSDTPTNNFCVLNGVLPTTDVTVFDGGLKVTTSDTGYWPKGAYGTIAVTSGKWYWESSFVSGSYPYSAAIVNPDSISDGYWYYYNGVLYIGNTAGPTFASYAAGDILGVALDMDNKQVTFYKNGVAQPVQSITGNKYTPAVADANSSTTSTTTVNFGQQPLRGIYVSGSGSSYVGTGEPPTGFLRLCTANLPAVAITNPKQHFDIKTHVGAGASPVNVTGVQFKPDFAWVKCTNAASTNHYLADVTRGSGVQLKSNTTGAEAITNGITSFNSDGITVANISDTDGNLNTFVDWLWKANGAGVTNTSGSITSTVSANTTAGFSVVTYTGTGTAGATVGHGLGAALKMIIIKNRGAISNWRVGHGGLSTAGSGLYLNLTNLAATSLWNNTAPTSTVFTLDSNAEVNSSGANYVAYCFTEIPGYSKFGSYVGNGSTDGPFVYCGFRPRFVLAKIASGGSAADWLLIDTVRNTYNVMNTILKANASTANDSSNPIIDSTANGFKVRTTTEPNQSSGTYIYAAFAEYPFGGSNTSPSPAR
jgi:hypothetical protein